MNPLYFAFSLTFLAGAATGIGSSMALFSKKFNPKLLSGSLGFSAGVMIYVAFVEIFSKANHSLSLVLGERLGQILTTSSFFLGIAMIALIDKLIPSYENPHEISNINHPQEQKKLFRMGLFSALALSIHNFPEGFATFISALNEPKLGISIAIAIAIHNIPEGMAVAMPIYYSTKNRKKAFWLSFLSGLTEPLGAFIGFFLLKNFFNDLTFGIVFALVAGIMVYISLDELLPTAEEYGEHHIAISGLILGMIVMAISLILF